MPQRHELRLPELAFRETPITVSLWLVDRGVRVTEGDRLIEILAGAATIDLPAPASGVLADTFVVEDETLHVGQLLGVIVADDEDD